MSKRLSALLLVLTFLMGCSHRLEINREGVVDNQFVRVNALWVKNKGDAFDLALEIENKHKQELMFNRSDLRCKKGEHQGRLTKTQLDAEFFNQWRIGEGQRIRFYIVCELDRKKVSGDYVFTIKNLFELKDGREKRLSNLIEVKI